MKMKLTISENQIEEILNPGLLGKRLRELASSATADRPVMVSIDDIHDHNLAIGLTHNFGFVQVSTADDLPPYMVTLGDDAEDGIRAYYYHHMHHTEVQRKHEIPLEDAILVAVEFAKTGQRSLTINWTEI